MKNNAQQRQHVCYDDDRQEQSGTAARVGKGLVRFLGVAVPVVAGAAVGVVKAAGELLATTQDDEDEGLVPNLFEEEPARPFEGPFARHCDNTDIFH